MLDGFFFGLSRALRSVGCAVLMWPLLAAQGQVTISELMYHPVPARPEDPALEWLELHNSSAVPVSLEGWQFTKGVTYIFPPVSISAGGRLVVAANVEAFRHEYPGVSNVVGGWSGKLRNDGENLELKDSAGRVAATLHYFKEGDWAIRRAGTPYPGHPEWWRGWDWFCAADGGGFSLELIDETLPGDHGQNWGASKVAGGTPGAANSIAANRSAPLISKVRHYPPVPLPSSTVRINATITSGLTGEPVTVTLWYRPNNTPEFLAVPMNDDGLHQDGSAGDSEWGCVLPAQPDKTVVEFYVEAKQAALSRTWPAPTDDVGTQGANALFQVDASLYTGAQSMYRLVISSNDWAEWSHLMHGVSRGTLSDAQMNATVVRQDGSGTQVFYLAGVRNRGAGTRTANPHNLHLSIPQDRVPGQASRLNFNTRTVQSQVAGNVIFSAANLINAYGAPVQVRVNGTNLANPLPAGWIDSFQFGSYFCFEPYDSDWAARHVPDDPDGNLYKGVWYFDGVRLRRGADLEYLGEDPSAYEQVYGENGPTSETGAYLKQNNVAEDDWSDLIALTRALGTNTSNESYVSTIQQELNLEQWLRFIAANALILNMETTLANGAGDDFAMYRGVNDRRFLLLNHDLDTVLGQGDSSPSWTRSIFKAADLPALARLLKHPEIAPRYFRVVKEMAETTFSPPVIGGLLDQALGGWVPEAYIKPMKDAAEQRRTNVLAQIPQTFSIASPAPIAQGFHVSTNGVLSLVGTANAITTHSVLVNGANASYSPWQGTWSRSNTALRPGLNRLLVQFMAADGTEVARTNIEAWFDTGRMERVTSPIVQQTTWKAAAGPYFAEADLVVNTGATLIIEPGTTVYFGADARLVVNDGGRLIAEGSDTAPIWFGTAPGDTGGWGGFEIRGSAGSPESRIEHAVIQGHAGSAFRVEAGAIRLGFSSFSPGEQPYLVFNGASFEVTDCEFPAPSTPVPALQGTNGIRVDGRGVVRNSFFAGSLAGSPVVAFTGGRRQVGEPILHFTDNVCTSASGDVLALYGADAWVEGNQFLRAHNQDGTSTASAVRLGTTPWPSTATLTRNLVFDCDRAITVDSGSFGVLLQNTILSTKRGDDAEGGSAVVALASGSNTGALLQRNIIWEAEALLDASEPNPQGVVLNQNLLSSPWHGAGSSNLVAAPLLHDFSALDSSHFETWSEAQVAWSWVAPTPGSPAKGAEREGDLGASHPGGIVISTAVENQSGVANATFTFNSTHIGSGIPAGAFPNGAGYTHYRWCLDNGPWSAPQAASTPLLFHDLTDGPHSLQVIGRRDSGSEQDDPAFSRSPIPTTFEWRIATETAGIRLNEVLAWAENGGADQVELYNTATFPVDLSGGSLTDTLSDKTRFIFPTGTIVPAGGYLVLHSAPSAPGQLNLGFGLDREGDSLYLIDTPARGQRILSQVTFGPQAQGYSIGILRNGTWGLCNPTLGGRNSPQPLEAMFSLQINEWLASGAGINPDDFIELYNPTAAPIALDGLRITDAPAGSPELHQLPLLSFIGPRQLALFTADGQAGQSHLPFKLSQAGGALGLFSPELRAIDTVVFGPPRPGVAEGRVPDGAESIRLLPLPTPGIPNPLQADNHPTNRVIEIALLPMTNVWRFAAWGTSPGADWNQPWFEDTQWPSGPGLLGHDSSSPFPYPQPVGTELPMNDGDGDLVMTYYFRSPLVVATNLTGFSIRAEVLVDDGAIFYLNGERVANLRLTNNPVAYEDRARNQSNEGRIETLEIPVGLLKPGTNLLAVEVHQTSSSSSDVMFGTAVTAWRSQVVESGLQIVLNEVLAKNTSARTEDGALCDWIEIANPASTRADLSGCSLSDSLATPRRWIFPAGVFIEPGGIRVVKFDSLAEPSSGNVDLLNTGFGLNASGDSVLLFDSQGALLDAVVFGPQAADLAIGKALFAATEWVATTPSPGGANIVAELATPDALRLNEWAASVPNGPDWFEIYNPGAAPVALGGLYLTDRLSNRNKHRIALLAFIGSGFDSYSRFIADGAAENGPDHVGFSLDAGGEALAIYAEGSEDAIDSVTFGPQLSGSSQGRYPDGAETIVSFTFPSPAAANFLDAAIDTDGDGMPDGWESLHGLNLLLNDALYDQDEDGISNLGEFLCGTDPRDASSSLRLQVTAAPGSMVKLEFTAVPGRTYSVLVRDSISTETWKVLRDVSAQPEQMVVTVTDTPGATTRFYRVMTPAGP